MNIKVTSEELIEIPFEELSNFSETKMIELPRKIVLNFFEDDKIIAFVAFNMRYFNKNACITYFLIPEKRGIGKGKEILEKAIDFAFKELNLERITTEVYEYNKRSIKILERFGFKLEGRIRKGKYHNGNYYDILIFGLLKEERAG